MTRRPGRNIAITALALLLIAGVLAGGLALGLRLAAADNALTVSSLAVTTTAGADNEYHAGDDITVRATFSQTITAYSGASLDITIGSATRAATLADNASYNSATLDFTYTVTETDADSDGITVAASALTGTFTHSGHAPGSTAHTALTLPTLSYPAGANQASNHLVNVTTVSYDTDNDGAGNGLIDISNLAQLNAIRWDLDGDGAVDNAANAAAYAAAFPARKPALGCPDTADADANPGPCLGYELKANLDFDTNADGVVDAAGDDYWNAGAGWQPIGGYTSGNLYNTTFQGNGKIIHNLFINRTGTARNGLFNSLGPDAEVTALGIHNASITGADYAGILANTSDGKIAAVYTTGAVSGATWVGGLVGSNGGSIVASYSTASAYVRKIGNNFPYAGGLVGANIGGSVTASYATGPVTGQTGVGAVPGGLIGRNNSGTVTNSYWDKTTTGQTASEGSPNSAGLTTSALQTPTAYNVPATGNIYAQLECGCGRRHRQRRPLGLRQQQAVPPPEVRRPGSGRPAGYRQQHCHHQQPRRRRRVPRRRDDRRAPEPFPNRGRGHGAAHPGHCHWRQHPQRHAGHRRRHGGQYPGLFL